MPLDQAHLHRDHHMMAHSLLQVSLHHTLVVTTPLASLAEAMGHLLVVSVLVQASHHMDHLLLDILAVLQVKASSKGHLVSTLNHRSVLQDSASTIHNLLHHLNSLLNQALPVPVPVPLHLLHRLPSCQLTTKLPVQLILPLHSRKPHQKRRFRQNLLSKRRL
jgi:hypothetical protein